LVRRVIAEAVRRQRPPESWWWATPNGYSYPSRHVVWAVLGYGAAADLLGAGGARREVIALLRAPAVGVAATRVVLAVHWPSDVLAAAVFAASWRRLAAEDADARRP
jgi:membrane-associated phospholipid phosphatase